MRFFSIRLALAAVVVTGMLLVFGVAEINDSLKFRTQKVLTYEQFVTQKPQEGWFRITGGSEDIVASAWEEDTKTHKIDKAFVPISAAKDDKTDDKTYLLMETKDEATLETASQIKELGDEKAVMEFAVKNPERSFQKRDIEGMIKTGLSEDSKTREELSKLDNSLAPNYVILQEGKHPSLGLGIGMFLGGLLLAVLQVLFYLRRRITG